jgi:D-arabinose 1-dehydrogenase-like Zn-dependent alcohol dehydrogenase
VLRLPRGLEPSDVAAHADAGLAAYHAVRRAAAHLRPGWTAVVIGAGGLGHIGIQCLVALTPAEVVAVDRSEEALDLARDLGAARALPGFEDADDVHADAVLDFEAAGSPGARSSRQDSALC